MRGNNFYGRSVQSTDSLAIAAKNAAHAIVRNLTIAHFDNFLDEEGEK